MSREYIDYLRDILDAVQKSQNFTQDMDYEAFKRDDKTIYAVVRALEVIGEAVKHIPDEIRMLYSDIPWKDMAGMRDVLIHDYFGVDVETVWLTVKEKLPHIKPLIEKIIQELQ